MRAVERLGRDELAARAGLSSRVASYAPVRNNMLRLAQLDTMTGQLIRPSKQIALRYQHE